MELSTFILFSVVLAVVSYVSGQSHTFVIIPEKTYLVVLEGHPLQLECVTTFNETGSLKFKKDGVIIENSHTYYKLAYSKTEMLQKLTLWTTQVDPNDIGDYTCIYNSYQVTTRVCVVTASATSANLPEESFFSTEVKLHCIVDTLRSTPLLEYRISWERGGESLRNDDKFNVYNGTLTILNPTRADMGAYQCVIKFFEDSVIERQILQPNPSSLRAKPAILHHDSETQAIAGNDVMISCNASGFPVPEITWYKGNENITSAGNMQILTGNATSTLMFSPVQPKDQGEYMCVAENSVPNFKASEVLKLIVKESDRSSGAVVVVQASLQQMIPVAMSLFFTMI